MSRRDAVRLTAWGALAAAGALLVGCAPEPRADTSPGDRAPDPAPAPAPESDAPSAPQEAPMLLLASLAQSDAVAIIDPSVSDAEAVQLVTVGAAPWGVGVAGDGRTGYAATAEGLAVIDLGAASRTALVPFLHPANRVEFGEYRPGGLGLAVSPDGNRVYVAVTPGDGAYALEVFDTRVGEFVGSVPVGLRPFDVVVAPDGTWAATIDHDGFTVTVVDAAALVPTSHTVAPFGTEGGLASWEKPHYGAVDAAGAILLPYQGRVVVRLDPRTGETAALTSRGYSHAHGTALAGDVLMTVGTGAFGNAQSGPNLSLLRVTGAGAGEERVVPLDVPHETVAMWRDAEGAEFAAVAGGNTRNEGWDGITLVSLDSLETRALPVAGYPQALVSYARS